MNALEYIDHILKGIVTGFFIAYLIVMGLRPAVMYPDNILDIIDNPWIFLVLLVLNYYAFLWNDTIGLLMFLTLIALILDIVIFTEGGIIKENIDLFSNNNDKCTNISQVNYISNENNKDITKHKDVNNMVLDQLKKLKNLNVESLTSHETPSFI